jgi:uncharacterized BrkB/YihY/UPF0761 family membrane protein
MSSLPCPTHRQWLNTTDNSVSIQWDVSQRNQETAMLSILLTIFVLSVLAVFVLVINSTISHMVVGPLQKMFNTILVNAAPILASVDMDEVPLLCKP